jgi:hypothetical protein
LGLAALRALLLGLTTGWADEAKKKPAKKKAPPAARQVVPFGDMDDLFDQLPPGFDDEHMKEVRKHMAQMRERMDRMLREMQKQGGFRGGFPAFPALPDVGGPGAAAPRSPQEDRLGAQLSPPGATLADQLDLPREQGMVLEAVGPNSAAAKAGLKAHDILLEVAGKAVPSKREDFGKLLASIEPNRKVEVVVMRKGKKETFKDLSLPEAKAVARPGVVDELPAFPGGRLRLPNLGGMAGVAGSTTVTRNNDEFTARNRSGDVTLTVKGTVEDGKPKVSEVTVEADGKTKTYDSVSKVPAEHQEKAKKLAEMGARGGFRFRLR